MSDITDNPVSRMHSNVGIYGPSHPWSSCNESFLYLDGFYLFLFAEHPLVDLQKHIRD
jgi:hypothetical protein